MSPRCFKNYLRSYSTVKCFGHLCKKCCKKRDAVKTNVIKQLLPSVHFAGRFLEASWRRFPSSSGLSLSQFVLFLHVIPDRLDHDQISEEHWLSDKNLTWLWKSGKIHFWKCKLIFPTDTLQQKIEITDLKHFEAGENTSVLIILATTVIVCFTGKHSHSCAIALNN